MTIRHLEVFLAVSRRLSMTKAAEDLNMTQPAVSKAISELEAYYDTALFDRVGRSLYLRDEGRALLKSADIILSEMKETEQLLREKASFPVCRLCMNITVAEALLEDLCEVIQSKDPMIDLHVEVRNSAGIKKMIQNNETDIALTDTKDSAVFSSTFLYEEKLVFAASAAMEIKGKKDEAWLKGQRILLREEGSGNRHAIDEFLSKAGYSFAKAWIVSSDEVLIRLLKKGFGIAVMPESYVRKHPEDLKMLSVEGFEKYRKFYLTVLQNKYQSQAVQKCIRLIEDYCRNNG